jgi:hypothetical protein
MLDFAGPTMAKPKSKGRPKTSDRNDKTARVDSIILGKAKLIATHRGMTVAELLSELLAVPIDRAYAQMLRELDERSSRP